MHIGSLVAAVGSFLEARHHGGRWLVRIEDLDTPRVVPGAADDMLRTLERLGLAWDAAVEYQSRRIGHYEAAWAWLRGRGFTFECSCSRSAGGGSEAGYPGTCREGPTRRGPTATRLRVHASEVCFEDAVQGHVTISRDRLGDVVIRRRDGIFSYQLAVVVDDAAQGVSHVVRGFDLLDSTGWQILLQQALGLPRPRYAHLPLVLRAGAKLSKSRGALPADPARAGTLFGVLRLLNQEPPEELRHAPPGMLMDWGIRHWHAGALRGVETVPEPMELSN